MKKGILNLEKKIVALLSEKPEYAGLVEANGKEVTYVILPQPAVNKKLVQASIVLENGEEWTVFKDQLIIEEEKKENKGVLTIPVKEIEKLTRAGIYEDLIEANGTIVEYSVIPQPAISKDMVMATVILNETPYGVRLKYIK